MTTSILADASNLAPHSLSLSKLWIKENSPNGTEVGTLSAVDPENGALTYELIDDAGGRFSLAGDKISVANGSLLDFETAIEHTIKVRVTDDAGNSVVSDVLIKVSDIWNETGKNMAPYANIEGMRNVTENEKDGTVVGTLIGFDDQDAPVSFRMTDSAGGVFKLVGNQIVVANGAKIDFEQSEWLHVTVEARDPEGAARELDFSFLVRNVVRENMTGSARNDSFVGGKSADKLSGGNGNDKLSGAGGNDKLYGDAGNDIISGGLGKDFLSGGKGKDTFVFDATPGKSTIDRIADFSVKDDTIRLAKSVFTDIAKKGVLSKDAFWKGAKAQDADDRIGYDAKSGLVYYDADGSGEGSAVAFAQVGKGLTKLSHLDFFVF